MGTASDEGRIPEAKASRLWPGIVLAWAAFWLLMLLVGIQEQGRAGGRDAWRPFVDYGTAALVATAIACWDIRRPLHATPVLNRPLRWFAWRAVWLPPVAIAYVGVVYGLRHAIYALFWQTYRHESWGAVLLYETVKFGIFYALFSGVHFGLRSYSAWHAERLRTEQQASLARQAQLVQLAQQLHPHFLFNALNTVSSLIHSDPDLADALLTRFASLLRAAMNVESRLTQRLDEELTLLAAYAQIMTQRFSDRVEVVWEIDPDTRACEVPTLGLQPLLENCFRHVVERRRTPTRIVVRAHRAGGRLRIEVEDNGDPHPATPLRRGVGLGNLAQRLQSMHGERARLELLPREEGGLLVRVELPCAS